MCHPSSLALLGMTHRDQRPARATSHQRLRWRV